MVNYSISRKRENYDTTIMTCYKIELKLFWKASVRTLYIIISIKKNIYINNFLTFNSHWLFYQISLIVSIMKEI